MADDLNLGKAELLARALDRAAAAGKLQPSAIPDALELLKSKVVVDTTLNACLIDGESLDDGVAKWIEARPHVRPQAASEITARADLEARALAGNVSAHGLLMKDLGKADYDAWCKRTGAVPGKKAVNADDGDKQQHKNNPWATLRDANGKVDPASQARVTGIIGSLGPKVAAELAKAVDRTLDGRPLRKVGA